MSERLSVFKNTEKEKEYMTAYDEAMELWPVPYQTTYVVTRFGDTYVTITGAEDGEPILLLPGFGNNSASWYPNVEALGADYRLYAVDTIDDLGKSHPLVVPQTRQEVADWLQEVCEGLDIKKAHVAGLSTGAFLAINFVSFYPESVDKVILLAPAAIFGNLSLMFWLQIAANTILPFRRRMEGFINWMVVDPDTWANAYGDALLLLGSVSSGPIKKVYPSVLSDEELRSITHRTLLLSGDHEVMYQNLSRARQRAQQLMPDLELEVVPNCGHAIPMEKPELVNRRILEFLAEP